MLYIILDEGINQDKKIDENVMKFFYYDIFCYER